MKVHLKLIDSGQFKLHAPPVSCVGPVSFVTRPASEISVEAEAFRRGIIQKAQVAGIKRPNISR